MFRLIILNVISLIPHPQKPPPVHRDYPVAAVGQGLVVGYQHQGGLGFVVHFEQQVGDALAGFIVEVAGGFVGEQDVRGGYEGAGEGDALLFAAGELFGVVHGAFGEAGAGEGGLRARTDLLAVEDFQRQHDIFQRGEVGHELEGLEDEADVPRPHFGALVFVQVGQGVAGGADDAAARQVEAGQQPQQGGFSGAGDADDGHRFAALHAHGNVVQDLQGAPADFDDFIHAAGFDDGFAVLHTLKKRDCAPIITEFSMISIHARVIK